MSTDLQTKRRKKKKASVPELSGGAARPKKHKVNPLKARVRDLERLLAREGGRGMPANVRVERERELAACKHELAGEQGAIKRQEMIRKYHMVRFFDRRKAERRLKKIKKQLGAATGSDEREKLTQVHHIAEVESNYTTYYPLAKPYVALYPKGDNKTEEDDEIPKKRGDPAMWGEVERAMAEGTLHSLREGQHSSPGSSAKSQKSHNAAKMSKRNKGDQQTPGGLEEDGDNSDGGFFE